MAKPLQRLLGGGLAALLLSTAAMAEPPRRAGSVPRVAVRALDQPGSVRLTFAWPRATGHSLSVTGDTATLRFGRAGAIALAPLQRRLPRNILGLSASRDSVTLRLRPGATPRVVQLGPVVALDILDPAPAAQAEAAPASTPLAPSPAPAVARGEAPPPVPAEPGRLRLPFPAGTGAAALARGGQWILAFDAAREVDVAAVRRLAPGLSQASAEQRRSATLIRLPLDAAATLDLVQQDGAWTLAAIAAPLPAGSAAMETLPGPPPRLLLRVGQPGRVINLPDPEGDGLLQLGTVTGPGAGLAEPRILATLTLLPTRLGLALQPLAEGIALRAAEGGFTVPLPMGDAPQEPSPPTETLLDLPDQPLAALLQRRRDAILAVADAAAASHGPTRLALAEALLALGLAPEAQGLAQAAMEEDPRLEAQPRALLLFGAASLLAGRAEEAAPALRDPRLDAVPEAQLWRGLLAADAQGAAQVIAQRGTLQRYPMALRARLVPRAAELLMAENHLDEAALLLRGAGVAASPRLALAEARLLEARGQADAALAAYAVLAGGRDQDVRALAMQRAAGLRLASGRDDARRAAAAMEAASAAWRGDDRELALRQRAAALRLEAGEAAVALALLRETEELFPDAAEPLRAAAEAALPRALLDPALPPIAALRLVEQWPEPLPAAAAEALGGLADRLRGLDLHPQAAAMLRRAIALQAVPGQRARLGLQLARALAESGDLPGAVAALGEVPEAALPGAERAIRARLDADLRRRGGDEDGAARMLRGLGPAGAGELAEMLAARQDWAGAARALAGLAAAIPPAPAPLSVEHRALLLKLAAYTGLAGDEAGLAALRGTYAARVAGGPLAEAFAMLTAGEVAERKPNLDRLRQETAAARALQDQLRSLR
ncbi:hypothetical protein [Roseicella aquatilis]|uniref:Tetratricopeptide repeat protein n=1 Tax=Roseicella aquatilis TaxID=2527868 RepID=A0A4R4D365_9PROT|nr:hypothetical protein [Roseicella aquatilis]TCZ53672.1 hypothetical protein EXY23_24405 [Roseicella aquatilis]